MNLLALKGGVLNPRRITPAGVCDMRRFFSLKTRPGFLGFLLFLSLAAPVSAGPLYSPTWGFRLDLPEGYEYVEGNGLDRYSFQDPNGSQFDLVVYNGIYSDVQEMADDVSIRLGNSGDAAVFDYGNKAACLMELHFQNYTGWGLCIELAGQTDKNPPLLLALAYASGEKAEMDLYHLSALDSIIPSGSERHCPGPIMEFGYPRGRQTETAIAGTDLRALIRENDAEAAQALIEREFALLTRYQFSGAWQEAWIRYYRMIYRDSWDRVADAVFHLERKWSDGADIDERTFAGKALAWVQGFDYERDLDGSDFVNLVSAVTEGRGDCDSRAMLWAMILMQADIPAAMMVSRNYGHAMGLADLHGAGARFEVEGQKLLVAETTAEVSIGLIGETVSEIDQWHGIIFDIHHAM